MSMSFEEAKKFLEELSVENIVIFYKSVFEKVLEAIDRNDGIYFLGFTINQRNALISCIGSRLNDEQKSEYDQTHKTKIAEMIEFCRDIVRTRCMRVSSDDVMDFLKKEIEKNPEEFGITGWFRYFWTEKQGAEGSESSTTIGDADRVEIIKNSLFIHAGTWVGVGPNRKMQSKTLQLARPWESIKAERLRCAMTEIMKGGFERYPATEEQLRGSLTLSPADSLITDYMLWAGENISGNISTTPVCFRWRGDSRPPSTIRNSGGFQRKVLSETWATPRNLNRPWHPFFDPEISSYMWYRKGKTDNCFYTTISIGTSADFKSYLPYPLIKNDGIEKIDGYKGEEEVTVRKLGAQDNTVIKLPVSETYLYLFVLVGQIFDTQKRQQKSSPSKNYPEQAVSAIEAQRIFGCVKIRRIHRGDLQVKDEHGIIVQVVKKESQAMPGRKAGIRTPFGTAIYTSMRKEYEEAENLRECALRWNGDGYININLSEPFTYKGEKYIYVKHGK